MIDVVVPIYNQLDLVAQCIDCLKSQEHVGRIIAVDDASTDLGVVDYLDSMRGITLLRHDLNAGFLHAANHGMEYVDTEFAVIVNTDVTPLDANALWALAWSMQEHEANVGGAKLLFASGSNYGGHMTIQHAGVGFNPDGRPYHPYMHLHPDTKAANKTRMVNAATGAVFGVRTGTWRTRGGFDPTFAPGVYEDVDYCLSAGSVVYESRSEWLHLMHGSQTEGHNLFDNEPRNLKLLWRKWGRIECDEELYYNEGDGNG